MSCRRWAHLHPGELNGIETGLADADWRDVWDVRDVDYVWSVCDVGNVGNGCHFKGFIKYMGADRRDATC